ncbi:peptidoglycan DD-metalloendopeptidase family protein [Heliobacterium undosum]|uniref:Peptidoglycan DD-metalloendopeptidase family protein n=1 Tax=Heliomicrobium undosum TaxID=121734 RepID=A0A845LCW7_9FIRM|nr:M23 family metallopeptidase [Heliomicrobium undosum]MZP30751.1 peptidoglycan DD-metalloendopeptidase family protein [Heliomicrobium undosum]
MLFSLIFCLLLLPSAGFAAEGDLWRLLKGDLALAETADRGEAKTAQEPAASEGRSPGASDRLAEGATERWRLHRVAPGETLYGIARVYGFSVAQLRELNSLKTGLLQPGQSLRLPLSGDPVVYEARRDTDSGKAKQALPSRGAVLSSLVSPLEGTVTSPYGPRRGAFHHGIDIAADKGETIRAAQRGRVVFTGWKAVYGRTVIIEHSFGVATLYAHSSKILVNEGDAVERGQPVAQVGATGVATGPHLHFEVRLDSRAVNPAAYLRGASADV